MSLLSYTELQELITAGVINAAPENVNAASIDITLGNTILSERMMMLPNDLRRVHLGKRDPLNMTTHTFGKDGDAYILYPGEFILAQSQEVFNLPLNISAEYKLKSSMARIGLEHLNAGWCDAGWNGSVLTLELRNMTRNHEIVLKAGDKIGQVVFFKHAPVPHEASYAAKGSYNGDTQVTGVKK